MPPFYRENNSAFSSLVDSGRTAPTHAARRSQQLTMYAVMVTFVGHVFPMVGDAVVGLTNDVCVRLSSSSEELAVSH